MQVRLDNSKLLGFKILDTAVVNAQLGAKVGGKPSAPASGLKIGAKVGGKPAPALGGKIGAKVGGKLN